MIDVLLSHLFGSHPPIRAHVVFGIRVAFGRQRDQLLLGPLGMRFVLLGARDLFVELLGQFSCRYREFGGEMHCSAQLLGYSIREDN